MTGEPDRPFTAGVIPVNTVIPAGGTTVVNVAIRQGNPPAASCNPGAPPVCRAKISATEYKNFMCHNLGAANTGADPFTPGWEINGGYWQWGRLAQAAPGPTGPGAGEANDAAISGWNTSWVPDGAWTDASKTANDPCPAGYRIPTQAQWQAVINNNAVSDAAGSSWIWDNTNYNSGKKFGDELMLPAAGGRYGSNGVLDLRGYFGYYWSSTEYGAYDAWNLLFGSSGADTYPTSSYNSGSNRWSGLSVRCIAE